MHVAWLGFVDDAAALPPSEQSVLQASTAYAGRTLDDGRELVGSLVVRDTDLPLIRGVTGPVTLAVTGGAGQVAGPAALAGRLGVELTAVDVALRDLDDLAGNARRITTAVDAARDDGSLGEDVPVRVGMPAVAATASWLTAVDVAAEADLRIGLRLDAGTPAQAVLGWVDAALDRERPFAVTAGLGPALSGPDPDSAAGRVGFLNLLATTTLLWDGVPDPREVLTAPDLDRLLGYLPGAAIDRLAGGRRWFTGFATSVVDEPWHDLRTLGLA